MNGCASGIKKTKQNGSRWLCHVVVLSGRVTPFNISSIIQSINIKEEKNAKQAKDSDSDPESDSLGRVLPTALRPPPLPPFPSFSFHPSHQRPTERTMNNERPSVRFPLCGVASSSFDSISCNTVSIPEISLCHQPASGPCGVPAEGGAA